MCLHEGACSLAEAETEPQLRGTVIYNYGAAHALHRTVHRDATLVSQSRLSWLTLSTGSHTVLAHSLSAAVLDALHARRASLAHNRALHLKRLDLVELVAQAQQLRGRARGVLVVDL